MKLKYLTQPLFILGWLAAAGLFISLTRSPSARGEQPIPHFTAPPASSP
jgi:hypothetical protein